MIYKSFLIMMLLLADRALAQNVATQPRIAIETTELRDLVSEIKKLRLDLLRVLVDTREQTIYQIERDLRGTDQTRESLQEQEKSHNLEVAELDERLKQIADPQERAELEKARAHLISSGPRRLDANKQALVARQAELNGLLNYARHTRNHLASIAAALERELSSRP